MTMTCIVPIVAQGWCVMKPNTWNYCIPVTTERKPTVDEMYLQALEAKYRCAALMKSKDVWSSPSMYDECLKDFDAAIGYYKRLVEKRSHE